MGDEGDPWSREWAFPPHLGRPRVLPRPNCVHVMFISISLHLSFSPCRSYLVDLVLTVVWVCAWEKLGGGDPWSSSSYE